MTAQTTETPGRPLGQIPTHRQANPATGDALEAGVSARLRHPRRPVVRYHGGKWKLAPWIISHFPPHRVYVEPFGGGASVLLRKDRCYAEVYNDLDGDLVNLFRVLRNDADAARLITALRLTPFSRVEFENAYVPSADAVERARRTLVRAFQGFGSAAIVSLHRTGFRSNSSRSGTTPAHDWANYPAELAFAVDRLRGVVIESRDFADVVRKHDTTETLVYADPPYPHSTRTFKRRATGQVYSHEMTNDDHTRMAEVLRDLKSMVVVSGYPCDLYDRDLFADWTRVERPAFADGARKRVEVLWLNAQAAQRCRVQSPLDLEVPR